WFHVHGTRRARCGVAGLRGHGGPVPPVHARFLQGVVVPGGRQRDARDGRRDRHAPLRRPPPHHAHHAPDVPVRGRRPGGNPAALRVLEQGPDYRIAATGRGRQPRPRRLVLFPAADRAIYGGVDGVLHVPGVF